MIGTHDSRLIGELISACHDGEQFYYQAAKAVENSELGSLFLDMAVIRGDIVRDLTEKVQELQDMPVKPKQIVTAMQISYRKLHDQLGAGVDYHYVKRLEQVENDTLEKFKAAIRGCKSCTVAEKIATHLATLQLMRDRMHLLRQQLYQLV